MKFWKSFSVEISDWEMGVLCHTIPKGYGYGYREFCEGVTHYYLFPFNYLVQLWRLFLYRIVYGARPKKWEVVIHRRICEGFNTGYDKGRQAGYEQGLADGIEKGRTELADLIDREIDKRQG